MLFPVEYDILDSENFPLKQKERSAEQKPLCSGSSCPGGTYTNTSTLVLNQTDKLVADSLNNLHNLSFSYDCSESSTNTSDKSKRESGHHRADVS